MVLEYGDLVARKPLRFFNTKYIVRNKHEANGTMVSKLDAVLIIFFPKKNIKAQKYEGHKRGFC